MDDKDKTFTVYNSKAGWKYKFTQGLKANGENQAKEVKAESDDMVETVRLGLDALVEWDKQCTDRGIKHVDMYVDGRNPNV